MNGNNIVMVGAGGTASHLIHPLICYMGGKSADFTIHVWDADSVEDKNLARQLFFRNEVGKNKARAFEDRYPNEVVAHEEFISEGNILLAIQESDGVLICADNMAVRRLVNSHCRGLSNVLVVNGGNELDTGSVQTFLRKDSKNITPPLDFNSPEFAHTDAGADPATMSCAEIALLPGGEQTVMANQSVAAFMLQALHRVFEKVYDEDDPQWTKLTFNIPRGTVQTSDVRLIGGYDSE